MRFCLCLLVVLPFLPACASHPLYTSSFLVGESVSVSATLPYQEQEAAAYSAVGVGPLEAVADPGLAWYRSDLDFRAELHLLLIGAHVAVEVGEIFDSLAGILFFDPEEDAL